MSVTKIKLFALSFLASFGLSFGVVHYAFADAPVDAGAAVVSDAGPPSAGSAVAVPDPIASPGDSIGLLEKLYKAGALVDAGILLAFFALTLAASRFAWLKQDHRAVYVSALLGGLALLAVPAAQGTTPTLAMVMSAVVTVVGLAVNPKKAAQA